MHLQVEQVSLEPALPRRRVETREDDAPHALADLRLFLGSEDREVGSRDGGLREIR